MSQTLLDWLSLPNNAWSDELTRNAFADYLEERGDKQSEVIRSIKITTYPKPEYKVIHLYKVEIPGYLDYSSTISQCNLFWEIAKAIRKLFTRNCYTCRPFILVAPDGSYLCPTCKNRGWIIK